MPQKQQNQKQLRLEYKEYVVIPKSGMCREIAFRFFVVGSRKVQYAIPASNRLFMKMID